MEAGRTCANRECSACALRGQRASDVRSRAVAAPPRRGLRASAGYELRALAAGRSAISADGSEVVFVTTARVEPRDRSPDGTDDPRAARCAVRDLGPDETRARQRRIRTRAAAGDGDDRPCSLVDEAGARSYGAVYPGGRTRRDFGDRPGDRETRRARGSAPRSAPTARPSPGWARTSASRRSCSPANRPQNRRLRRAAVAADRTRPGRADPARHRRLGPGRPRCAPASGETELPSTPSPSTRARAVRTLPRRRRRALGTEGSRRRLRPAAERRRLHGRVPHRRARARRGGDGQFDRARNSTDDLYVVDMREASRASRRCAADRDRRRRRHPGTARTIRRRSSTTASRPTAARSRSRPSARSSRSARPRS